VAEGTPEAVAASERSFTGQYLMETLAKAPRAPAQAGAQSKPRRSSRAKSRGVDADQPDLIGAK
jgi:excinuclease ABC subunit A